MENNSNKCFRCASFHKYYTMGVKQFNATKFGWCPRRAINVKNTDGCEKFHQKKYRRGHMYSLNIHLNNLLTHISVLRQILEEETKDVEEV